MPAGLKFLDASRVPLGQAASSGDPKIHDALSSVMARIEAICRNAKLRSGNASRRKREAIINANRE